MTAQPFVFCLGLQFLTGRGGAVEREREPEAEEGEVVPAVVTARIIICGLLIGFAFDQFAPLFGAVLQTFIQLIGGIFGQLFVAVLSIFNGLFGGLIGYTIAPIIGADTIHNNEFVKSLMAPHIGVGLTNFIGFNNGPSCPRGGTTTVTITEGFESIFECRFESPHGVFLATNNSEIVGLS